MPTSVAPDLRPYESLFIVPAETSQDKIDAFVEKLKAVITKDGGNFRSAQVWGRRRLTFSIKHNKDGLYVYVDFDGKNKTASEVQHLFQVTDMVIRYMTVHREEPPVIRPRAPSGSSTAAESSATGPIAKPETKYKRGSSEHTSEPASDISQAPSNP